MDASNVRSQDSARFAAPVGAAFSAGLRSIRGAIEARLQEAGIRNAALGDSSSRCARAEPSMVIVDVSVKGANARVTFTRDEVEDCAHGVEVFCVRRKIDRLVEQLRR